MTERPHPNAMTPGGTPADDDRLDGRSANRITDALVEHLSGICGTCGATVVFVYADALDGGELPVPEDFGRKIIYVTKTTAEQREKQESGREFLRVPGVPLTRLGQVKIAVLLALARGLIHRGDVVVFLAGLAGSGTLDTIIVTEVGREFEIYAADDEKGLLPGRIQPEVLERVIDLASERGREGREGHPVGALFVIGDADKVLSLSRPLILNPFRGYSEQERNLLVADLDETVKELSALDGAFVLRGDGVIESCGTFLKTGSSEEFELPRGLGARHHAAAGITAVTESIAITVSQSTGR
jgi:DNA integrity scanning protein DisA with diadenylate cyclase activity